MIRKLFAILLLFSLPIITGCPAIIVGAGAGTGAYTYIKGEFKKLYPVDFDTTIRESTAAMQYMKIQITERTSDGTKAIIRGINSAGKPVTITVERREPSVTEVGVRTGDLGFFDKKSSELIQANISNRLSR